MVSTYSEAGVDIDASERATEALIAQIKGVNRKGDGEAIKLDNGFAGLVKLGDGALAMCTDGVGSKLLLAEEMDSIHTVGIDCVAMNTNDLICVGAEPLSFVDYVALDKPDENSKQAVTISFGSTFSGLRLTLKTSKNISIGICSSIDASGGIIFTVS